MLELSGITKSYGTHRVLDDVGFHVAPGRLTGFVGGNGAGKTTFVNLLTGVLPASGGQVLLDGAGHWLTEERPEAVSQLLIEFLRV